MREDQSFHGRGGGADHQRSGASLLHKVAGAAALMVVVVMLAPSVVGAVRLQAPSDGSSQQNVTPGQLQELFETYVMMQAQRQLRLTDQQLPQFILRLRALQAARRRAAGQRQRIVQDLRQLTRDDKVDETQVRERLKALDDLDTKSAAEIKDAQASLDQILDVRQQAHFRMLEEQMERNKIELMMRARQRANPPSDASR